LTVSRCLCERKSPAFEGEAFDRDDFVTLLSEGIKSVCFTEVNFQPHNSPTDVVSIGRYTLNGLIEHHFGQGILAVYRRPSVYALIPKVVARRSLPH
jgi:hypothetical protein